MSKGSETEHVLVKKQSRTTVAGKEKKGRQEGFK